MKKHDLEARFSSTKYAVVPWDFSIISDVALNPEGAKEVRVIKLGCEYSTIIEII